MNFWPDTHHSLLERLADPADGLAGRPNGSRVAIRAAFARGSRKQPAARYSRRSAFERRTVDRSSKSMTR